MTVTEILTELKSLGNEKTRAILIKHGAGENTYGVKIEDMKKIQKRIKKNHELSLQLFDSGNGSAMYLAGLISEPQKMTKDDLQKWAENAKWHMLIGYTVAWVTAESRYGFEMAEKWIKSEKENVASAGWATLTSLVQILPDEKIDIQKIREYLEFIRLNLLSSKNMVRYSMNFFVIAAGATIHGLYDYCSEIGQEIGKFKVDMGDTACKVPFIPEYLKKIKDRGSVGKKRKTAFC